MHATHPVIEVPQQEIGVDINRSNISAATGGGLIFALVDGAIDHSRAKKAESNVTSLRDALVDFDFAQGLSSALTPELAKVAWLHAGPVEVRHATSPDAAKQVPKDSPADTVLVVDCDYRLSSGFASVTITTRVSLHARVATAGSDDSPLYVNTFSTLWDLPVEVKGTDPADRIKAWSNDHGAAAREVLGHGFQDLAAMIAYDIELSATVNRAPKDGQKRNVPLVTSRLLRIPPLRGTVEQERSKRDWVRMDSGELISVVH